MLKPGFILNRKLITFYENSHCLKRLLNSSTNFSRYFCYFTDRSAEIYEDMASKHSKKQKLSDSESASSADSASSDSEHSPPPRKEAKTKSKRDSDSQRKSSSAESSKEKSKSLRVEAESEPTWDLTGQKFIKINEFKGKTYVNIREYYIKDGKVLPGKKGISLNVEQWQNFCSSVDEVNQVLKK